MLNKSYSPSTYTRNTPNAFMKNLNRSTPRTQTNYFLQQNHQQKRTNPTNSNEYIQFPKVNFSEITDWSLKMNDFYSETTKVEIVENIQPNYSVDEIVTVHCIDGKIYLPARKITSGIISELEPLQNIHIQSIQSDVLKIVEPFILPKQYDFVKCSSTEMNALISTAKNLEMNNKSLFREFGKWIINHKDDSLEGRNETFVIETLLEIEKEMAYQLRDYLQLPQNTQKVFSQMILEKGIDDISCSVDNFGVICGYIAENIIKEGGKWYKDLMKLMITAFTKREYIQTIFVVSWRINMEEQCQKEFQEQGCFQEILRLLEISLNVPEIVLTFIEICILLLQNEENMNYLNELEVITKIVEVMKKNMTTKLVQSGSLKALALFCGIEENNAKMIDNRWIDVIKYIMNLYRNDESLQLIGLNIIVKLLPSERAVDILNQLSILHSMIDLLKLYKTNPNIVQLCFEVIKRVFERNKNIELVQLFPLLIEISHTFENDGSVVEGCIHICASINTFPNTLNYKSEKNITWLLELGLKFIDNEDVQIATTKYILSLIKDKTLSVKKYRSCVVMVSSLLQYADTNEQIITIVSIINKLYENKVDMISFETDIANRLSEIIKNSVDEEVIYECMNCLHHFFHTVYKESDLEHYDEWLNNCVSSALRTITEKISCSCFSLIKLFIDITREYNRLENPDWATLLYTTLKLNETNSELFKEIIKIRLQAITVQRFFNYNEIISLIPLIKSFIETMNNLELNTLTLQFCICLLCPFNENNVMIAQTFIESGLYNSLLNQSQTIVNQFYLCSMKSLIISALLTEEYPVYSMISLILWEIISNVNQNKNMQKIFITNKLFASFCNTIKMMPNMKELSLGIFALLSINNQNNEGIANQMNYIYGELLSETLEINEKRNIILLFALINSDLIIKEEMIVQECFKTIIKMMNQQDCPTEYIYVGLCALYNVCGFDILKSCINTAENKVILGNLMTIYGDCSEIIHAIMKKMKQSSNNISFELK